MGRPDWKDLDKWTNCSTTCESGTLYLETYVGEPGQVFLNVCSQSGSKHVGGFFREDLNDEPSYGWRISLEDYLAVDFHGLNLISKVDLATSCGITKGHLNDLLKKGTFGDGVEEGHYIVADSLETLVKNYEDAIKPGNKKKSENWVYRWKGDKD